MLGTVRNFMPKLYAWQQTAQAEYLDRKKGIVQATTGSGKTIFACDTILKLNPRICHVIVPRVGLINQWCEEFRSVGYMKPIGKFGGKHGAQGAWHDINVWTIDTARKVLNNPEYGGDGTMLVVDECHRSTSPTRRRIYQMNPEYCLGISASAFDGGTYLVNLVGGGLIYNYSFEDGLRDGVVNDYEIHHVGFSLSDDNQDLYDMATEDIKLTRRLIKSAYEGQCPTNAANWPAWVAEMAATTGDPLFVRLQQLWLERKRAIWSDERRRIIATDIVRNNPGERIVIFHQQIDECNLLYNELTERGVVCGVEHSGRPMSERRATIEGFRKGEFDLLITCRTLDEGFNVPNISIGIIAASSSTSTQMIQRVGRVIRKAARKGKSLIYRLSAQNTVDDFATSNLIATGNVASHRIRQYTYSGKIIEELAEERGLLFDPLYYTTLLRTTAGTFDYYNLDGRRCQLPLLDEHSEYLNHQLTTHGVNSGKFKMLSNGNLMIWRTRWTSIGGGTVNSEHVPNDAHWLVYTPDQPECYSLVKIYTEEEIRQNIHGED